MYISPLMVRKATMSALESTAGVQVFVLHCRTITYDEPRALTQNHPRPQHNIGPAVFLGDSHPATLISLNRDEAAAEHLDALKPVITDRGRLKEHWTTPCSSRSDVDNYSYHTRHRA
jgi:hypothetical protein